MNYLTLKSWKANPSIEIAELLQKQDDERLFVVTQALRLGLSEEKIHYITGYDMWFLSKLKNIVDLEEALKKQGLTEDNVRLAKRYSMPDAVVAGFAGKTEDEVRAFRQEKGITPTFKMVDTCAAEFEAATPYYYSCYAAEDEVKPLGDKSVVVLGSGPIRIGQGIEFDYCSVHSAWALRKAGMNSIIVNNNPETVSTDFDTSDSLYFEPLTVEDVMAVIDKEKPVGVICQFGGQTAINLAAPLAKRGVKVLGTSVEGMDRAEDRERFDEVLAKLNIPRPDGRIATSDSEAMKVSQELEFPLIVRPSYVLGGRAMEIVYNEKELERYLREAVIASPDHPILIDEYMTGREVEVDAVADGTDVFIPGIMEQVERAGVHSGDSIAVYPPQHLDQEMIDQIVDYTTRISLELQVKGAVNIQFVVSKGKLYIIEVNPRSSRTVPFLSKVTHFPIVEVATRIALGETLKDMGYGSGLLPAKGHVAAKAPVFSFSKIGLAEIALGPEMKSTGEVMGIGKTYSEALYKAVNGAKMRIPAGGTILVTVADRDKEEALQLAHGFKELGYHIIATEGTGQYFNDHGMPVDVVRKIHESGQNIATLIRNGKIDLVVNTLTFGKHPERDGFNLRRMAVELAVPCLTSLDTAREVLRVFANKGKNDGYHHVAALQDYDMDR